MSGTTPTSTELGSQPMLPDSAVATARVPVLNGDATNLATLDQIARLVITDTQASGSVETTSATPTILPNLPVMPNERSLCVLTGTVTAQNVTTGAGSVWDLTLNLIRSGPNVTPALIGGSDAGPVVRCQDVSMAGCLIVASISNDGPSLSLTGIANSFIEWGYTFTLVSVS